jgi:CheY-like chemotaxis protein
MNKRRRVLVVEDRPDWNHTLIETLEQADFDVDAAMDTTRARQLLDSNFYHVLILDIRMDEGDTSNIDGLRLLEELDTRGLTEAIQVIILSAYGTKEQMRTAFRDKQVADFIFKQRFNAHAFLDDVERVFSKDVLINLNIDIHWSGVSGPEALIGNLKLDRDDERKPLRVSSARSTIQKRAASELDDLLRRLFYQAESILVKPMAAGRSGTTVLEVRPFYASIGGGGSVVVKCGSARRIKQEYDSFKEYVEPLVGGKRCTSIHGVRRTTLLGGIIYTFLGASDELEDFGAFYRRSDIAQIKQAVDGVFLNTCIDWYANKSRRQVVDLTEDYKNVLHFTPEKLANAIQRLHTVGGFDQDHLYFQGLANQPPLKNPLRFLAGRRLSYPTYISPTHGDFNEHNLLVDDDGHIWMIDFQGTKQGHILRDFVGLDSVIRLQLLTKDDATLQERLEMEQALCSISRFSQVGQLAGKFQSSNAAIMKAYTLAVHLRTLAFQIGKQSADDDFQEYYAALFYNAVNTMRFMTLQQEQREHALLSASLLAERLSMED